MSVETNRTCKHCGLSYNVFNDVGSTSSYCTMCNAPTLIVVGFASNNWHQPAVFTLAHKRANAFFAEFGISADMIRLPPVATHVGYVFDELDIETYTLTYHLEVPAYVAQQIREARNA